MNEIKKVIIAADGKTFHVRDLDKDYHCQFGFIKKEDLKKKEGTVVTNTGKKLQLLPASFIDKYSKLRRLPQIIPLKDIGNIVTTTGVNHSSKVVDAGTGSGALACFLANIVKEVTSYELREDFIAAAEENVKLLQLKNIKIKNKDICNGIDESDVDLVTLDIPNPWDAVDSASKALKTGGFLVSYSPTIAQVIDFVEKINNSSFIHLKTIEIAETDWEVNGRKTRPRSQQIGHSGFMTFARKVM